MHHESQESSDHNMSLCVDIIRNIDKGITDDPFIFPDFVPPVFFSFWENTTKNLGPKYEISIYKTDPPHFSSQHLVWIIKLTI